MLAAETAPAWIRPAGGIVLALLGAWIVALNCGAAWTGYVRRERAPSRIPLLGPLLLTGAALCTDRPLARTLAWITFAVDPGSALLLAEVVLFHLRRRRKR